MPPKKAAAVVETSTTGRPQRTKRPATTEVTDTTQANTAKKRKFEAKPKAKSTATKTAKKPAASKAAAATKLPTNKPTAKKAAPSKTATATKNAANTSKKRKAGDDIDERPTKKSSPPKPTSKKAAPAASKIASKKTAVKKTKAVEDKPVLTQEKTLKKGPVINEPPTQKLDVLVFGEGSAGELGLGTLKNAVDVKRPRLNPNLLADKVGVVQIAAGGMHVVALTTNNKILTWGVNDSFALGRDTTWEGGLRDMDAEEDSSDSADEDSGLNPKEATPIEIDLSNTPLADGTRWTQVAAGDSCSFAITDDGKVYGWGTFRSNEGPFGFTNSVETAKLPLLIPELKNIVSIDCGANHALALDKKGAVFAWGSGQQNQLGRRVVERNKREALQPRQLGLPRGGKNNIKSIASGDYHSFAISHSGDVYAWGLNSYGETGILQANTGENEAVIVNAQLVESLRGKQVVSIKGGAHHSIAATATGECLVWGRCDIGQSGIPVEELTKLGDDVRKNDRGELALLTVPTKPSAIEGHAVLVAAGPDHSIVVTKEGNAYSTGFSGTYQTGLGTDEDVLEFTLIDNTAARDRDLNGAQAGGQFSLLTALAE